MVTMIGKEAKLETLLVNLIRLDFDAAAAYQSAIDRLENAAAKAAMREFKADHLRHTRELGACLRDMGRRPPHEGDMKELLTTGKVIMAGLLGDNAIIGAMRTNEDDTVTAYDRAVKHIDCTAAVLQVLKSAQRDEHRHREWMVAALKSKGRPGTRRSARKAPRRAAKRARAAKRVRAAGAAKRRSRGG